MYLQKEYIKKKKVVRRRILSVCMVCCMLLGLCGVNLISANAAEEAIKAKPIVLDSTDNTIPAQTNEQENEQLTDNVGVDSSQVIDNTNQAAADQNGYTNADQPADQSQNQTNSAQPGNDSIALQSIENNVYSDQMLGKFLTALGLSGNDFTVDNIQAAGIQDRNFAQAVYDSMISDQDDFDYVTITDISTGDREDDDYNRDIDTMITEGRVDGIIPTVGNPDAISGIKLIISYFSGEIKAQNKSISSIEGIKVLRRAWKIDLRNNQITDISCMEKENGELAPKDPSLEYDKYFGEECRNVYIYIEGNPLLTVFKETDGRVIIDLGRGHPVIMPEVTLSYLVTGKEKSGITTPLLPAEIVQKGKSLTLSRSGFAIVDRLSTMNVSNNDVTEKDEEGGFEGITIQGIKSSGKIVAAFSYEQAMMAIYADIMTDITATNEHSITANKTINLNLYTNVDIKYTSNGCIRLHKQDEKGNAIEGAEFNLYKCGDVMDEVIPEDEQNPDVAKVYKTDKNGNINVSGLDAGSYYFVETKVPDNYQQEVYGTSYTLTNAEATGTPISFDIAENDRAARYSLYKATGSAQSTDDVCLATGLKTEANGKVTGYVTENGTYYLVKRDVLKVTTVQKDAVNLTNTTRNVSAWKGDSMETTNEDGTTGIQSITATENSGGFYLKGAVPEKKYRGSVMPGTGDDTADQLAFSLKDTQSSPFYEATVKWTKSLSEDDENATGKMTYRIKRGDEKDTDKVTYCKDISEVQEKMQEKIQKLAGVEYRNVSVNVKFGGGYESADDWSADDSNVPSTTVTNPQKTTLKVYKQNDAGKLLEGAEFTLYRTATDADTDAVEVTVGGVKKKVVAVDKQTTAKESADADKAVATFKELANSSTYYLAETYLPTGHQYIKKDGADYEYAIGKVYEVTTDSKGDVFIDGDKAEGESGGHVFSITFTNVGITLPKSGFDGGYTLYTILAMLIITVAGVWLYMNKRKQKINF